MAKKLELSALTSATRTVTVRYDKAVVTLTYRLGDMDKDFYDRVLERDDDKKLVYDVYDYLPDLIDSWDIVDNGNPVAITSELLRKLPRPFIEAIDKKIFDDASPKNLTR